MKINEKVNEKITDDLVLDWFDDNIRTTYKIKSFLGVYQKLFNQYNINWVCGLLYISKKSNHFSPECLSNNNPLGLKESIGDKGEELIHFSALGKGLAEGIKQDILKLKEWPEDIVGQYNDILGFKHAEPVPLPKQEPDPIKKDTKSKSSFVKSLVFFLTAVTIILGMLSFIVPVLAPIATIIKGILSLINILYGGS